MSNKSASKNRKFDDSYWQYFLKLESDFWATSGYLGSYEINDTACSLAFAQQLVCIVTECESLFKKLCKSIAPKVQVSNMGNYKTTLLKKYPALPSVLVRARGFHRSVRPFAGWEHAGGRIDWWTAFQDIKFQRDKNIAKANLRNTLEALSALLILELYLYELYSPGGKVNLRGTVLFSTSGILRSVPASDSSQEH